MIPRGQYIGKPLGGPLYRPAAVPTVWRWFSSHIAVRTSLKMSSGGAYRSGVSMGFIPGLTPMH